VSLDDSCALKIALAHSLAMVSDNRLLLVEHGGLQEVSLLEQRLREALRVLDRVDPELST
jgi:hypothetical protein